MYMNGYVGVEYGSILFLESETSFNTNVQCGNIIVQNLTMEWNQD